MRVSLVAVVDTQTAFYSEDSGVDAGHSRPAVLVGLAVDFALSRFSPAGHDDRRLRAAHDSLF